MAKELVSMRRTAEDKRKDMGEPCAVECIAPDYPWGLTFNLDTDEIEKLGINRMPEVDTDHDDNEVKRWLQWACDTKRRAMYDRKTMFTRATKEGDNDFACFGQTVISIRLNKLNNALLYRCHHLRDCAWMEDEEGKIV